MVKEVLIGTLVGAATICVIYILVKYIKEQKESGITPERSYSDEVNIYEIKQWFSEKINSEDETGVLFYPTEENLKRWEVDMDVADNVIIQMVYSRKTNEVVSYREIAFGNMDAKLKELLYNNGGTVVFEK